MSTLKLNFRQDGHVTKRTYRFEEVDDKDRAKEMIESVIGKIYMKKNTFNGAIPLSMTVTLKW